MATIVPNSSSIYNIRRSFYCGMAKQKLVADFTTGILIGAVIALFCMSIVIETFFVSKNVFNLKRVYVNGRLYKIVEDRKGEPCE